MLGLKKCIDYEENWCHIFSGSEAGVRFEVSKK